MSSTLNTKPPLLTAASPPLVKSEDITPRRPSLSIKPSPMAAASPPAGSPGSASSLLSKEWVIPPRPKPGRKPATDTPPTKRKAQNRAAQRAFRERRAARVGELEEQMKQMEEEDEAEQNKLRADIDRLEKEVEQYRDDLTRWVERCRALETELTLTRKAQSSTDAVPLPRRTLSKAMAAPPVDADTTVGCGNCSAETNCQCLDEAFNIMSAAGGSISGDKRPHSPTNTTGGKRIKTEPDDNQEIDFTAAFASRPAPQLHRDPNDADAVEIHSAHSGEQDPCGFCSDGTPCICAQMAAESHPTLQHATSSNTTAHQLSHQGFTPPPSEGDVSSSVPLQRPTVTAPANPCASGPGTCAQCRADPNSTLFCKSLAASRSQSAAGTGEAGCCGGVEASSSACCRSTRSTRSRPHQAITLSCADAYTTLSRHPGYERAQGEMAGWMGKLLPVPVSSERAKEGKTAMEIDAANVMTVLKEFDRRFAD